MSNHSKNFDPISIWPSRVKSAKWKANSHDKTGGVGGATDLTKKVAYLPVANTAYDRTIRLHEALHAIYTPPPTKERIASKKPYTMLEQALEDARLHLVCAKTEGVVRRDELATALKDLHTSTQRSSKHYGCGGDKNLCALMALRASAILTSHAPDEQIDDHLGASKRLEELCKLVAPDYQDKLNNALEQMEANKMAEAEALLKPYFSDSEAQPESKVWMLMGKGGSDDKAQGKYADVSFAKVEGKLSSDAADMIPAELAREIMDKGTVMPTLQVHQLFAQHNIPTFFGETVKHTISGCKIHAKKLATVVGPSSPKLFLKTIRRNGGSILIDASGSMHFDEAQLIKMLVSAPAATIAFYNAPTDEHLVGNLWVFAHKGKRAADFSGIEFAYGPGGSKPKYMYLDKFKWPDTVYGFGNVVDFQALQWLLAQPAPRYVLTDGGFTGPDVSRSAAVQLLKTGIARKKFQQVRSLGEMQKILDKAGRAL